MAFIKPQRFGKYLILETLKSDPPIQEFRAIDTTGSFFSRFFKIKAVHPDLIRDEKAMHSLIFEARVSQELDHPNIVAFIDAGKMNGRPFIVQEYIWGRSLLQFFRKLRDNKKLMGHQHAAYIISEVCRGLNHAHAVTLPWAGNRPVVHQNLNPRNIILSFDGSVRVVDFGIPPVNMLTSNLAGYDFRRLGYLSPEQANRLGVDLRTDIFTAGTLLYEMLTGYPAYLEKTGAKVIKRIRVNNFTPVRSMNPTVPKELEAVVTKAMAEERGDRFASGLLMERVLDKYLDAHHKDFAGESLGSLLKGLFLKEIKHEIRTLHEMAKEAGREGGQVFKSVPVILFNLVKNDPRHKSATMSSAPKPAPPPRGRPAHAPTRPAIVRAAVVTDVEDDETILDVDYFENKGISKNQALSLSSSFSDEETRMLIEGTDPVIFEDESTILIEEDKYTFKDGNLLIKEARPAAGRPATDARSRENQYSRRSPTGYFNRLDRSQLTAEEQRIVSGQAQGISPMGKKILAFVGGMLLMAIIALVIILLTSCSGPATNAPATPPRPAAVVALEREGRADLAAGRFARCGRQFSRAVKLEPRNHMLWHDLGRCAEGDNRPQDALTAYDRALTLSPKDVGTLVIRGVLHGKLGKLDRAERDLALAARLAPTNTGALYHYGLVQHYRGHLKKAVALYSKALSGRADYFEALSNRGVARLGLGQFPEALVDFTRCVELRPRSALAWYNLGTAHARAAAYEDSVRDMSRALELAPSHENARLSRGLSQAILGRFQPALADFDRLIKANPKKGVFYVLRAEVHFELGAPERAAADAEKAKALGESISKNLGAKLRQGWYIPRLKELTRAQKTSEADALTRRAATLGITLSK